MNRKIRRITILGALLLSFGVAVSANKPLPNPANNQLQTLDHIVALVNDDVITKQQVVVAEHDARLQIQALHQKVPSQSVLRKQALDALIDQSMQLQLAARNNITVSAQEVKQAITGIAKSNGLDHASFVARLQQGGVSYKRYQENIKKQILVSKVQGKMVGSNIHISQQQLRDFMAKYGKGDRQYEGTDVLIPLSDAPTPDQLHHANQIAAKITEALHAGQSITQLQSKYPTIQVNQLGWRSLADLPDVFSVIKSMSNKQWSKPIRAANGIHLLRRLSSRRSASKLTTQQAQELLFKQVYAKRLDAWLKGLRQSAYVKNT